MLRYLFQFLGCLNYVLGLTKKIFNSVDAEISISEAIISKLTVLYTYNIYVYNIMDMLSLQSMYTYLSNQLVIIYINYQQIIVRKHFHLFKIIHDLTCWSI